MEKGRRIATVISLCSAALLLVASCGRPVHDRADVVVLISANMEWAPVRAALEGHRVVRTPFGEAVPAFVGTSRGTKSAVYVHGSWGKISAAASTQYAIDRWKPKLIVNLGTCGGFEGRVQTGDVILVTKTVTYDILEQMGDSAEAIRDYSTTLDLSWLRRPYPTPVIESVLVSGDRDIVPADIPKLAETYGAVAGDWESSAIAFTARRNATPVLILRAVSDVVGAAGSEAYGNIGLFERRAAELMTGLMKILPAWLDAASALPGL